MEDQILTFQFHFTNTEEREDYIRFSAHSEKEAWALFNNWCLNDEGLSAPYQAGVEILKGETANGQNVF